MEDRRLKGSGWVTGTSTEMVLFLDHAAGPSLAGGSSGSSGWLETKACGRGRVPR